MTESCRSRGSWVRAPRAAVGALAVVAALLGPGAGGAPRAARADGGAALPPDVAESVARTLFERGLRLYHERELADARQLFLESIEVSPQGAYAASARDMVRRCEAELGRGARPPGGGGGRVPAGGGGGGAAGPLDPYASSEEPGPVDPYGEAAPGGAAPVDPYAEPRGPGEGSAGEAPLDPYGAGGGAAPVDPYADAAGGAGGAVPGADAPAASRRGRPSTRKQLLYFGTSFGLWQGIALAGATDAGGGGILLALGGAGAGLGVAHLVTRKGAVGQGPAAAAMSASGFGTVAGVLFAHLADSREVGPASDDVTTDGYLVGSILGGAVGLAGGVVWAATGEPSSGDVALTDSLVGLGATGGLLLGGLIQPVDARAYSVNALLGGGAGLLTGLLLAPKVEPSPRRVGWMDLGAAAGAAAGWLVFPFFDDASAGARTASALSLGLAGGGAWLGWTLGGKAEARRRARAVEGATEVTAGGPSARRDVRPAPPALLGRDSDGRWRLAAPLVRPIVTPDGGPGRALVADVLSGWL